MASSKAAWPERLRERRRPGASMRVPVSGPSGRGGCGAGGQGKSFARKGDPFPLISTTATVGGDEGDEEQQIKRRRRRISGDVRDGAAAARATVQAARPTEHRCTGERK
jgi:hypothetical protein